LLFILHHSRDHPLIEGEVYLLNYGIMAIIISIIIC
jgi:hypothetical protein